MQNQEIYDKVMAAFGAKFGGKPAAVAYAPGRIEVLGSSTSPVSVSARSRRRPSASSAIP